MKKKDVDFRVVKDAEYLNSVVEEIDALLEVRGVTAKLGFNIFLSISQKTETGVISVGYSCADDLGTLAVALESAITDNKILSVLIAKSGIERMNGNAAHTKINLDEDDE